MRLHRISLPECGYHVTFVLPMPDSWSKKKRTEMAGKPHQQKPDKDNLEKALLDAIFEDDCRILDGRVTKVWGESPTFSDCPRATASDALTGTDLMAAVGMCQAQAELGMSAFLGKMG
ncbi:hypothetical protein PSTG_18543, partial [Puccinia striiformis f. sp. tritici PST-78]